MVSKAVRLAVLFSAVATSPMLAQQTATQLANLRHWSGQGVAPVDPATNKTFILSSVDHFDFNWHINDVYADEAAPLLPAGTVLHLIGIHDNTAANKRNPDPNMRVGFGERSVDDMLQVWLDMVYLDDAEYQRLVEERQAKPATSTTAQQPQR